MPRHPVTYNKDLKETQEFKFLYNKWRWLMRQPHVKAFDVFQAFYDWSMENGFVIGAKLERRNDNKPFSPLNCVWTSPRCKRISHTDEDKAWISLWNETVNRIRRHFGLEPIGEEMEEIDG